MPMEAMKMKTIVTVLLVALTVSCVPATTALPSETAVSRATFTPAPPRNTQTPPPATITEIPIPEPHTATGASTGPLSTQGPWLLYVHNSPRPGMLDSDEVPPEFILLNQDGSGRTSIALSECYGKVNTFLMEAGNSASYLAQYGGGLYLFRPSEATGMQVYGRMLLYSTCRTFFNGDEQGGLLASFYQGADDTSPELIIYELPGGNIRDRFPLVRCAENAKVCEEFRSNWSQMMEQEPQWSPNGRYLAFAALLDATTTDLFVYDAQDGSLRRLTNGPDWVGPIEWSPDGTRIIMHELLNDDEFFFAPSSKPPTSVWSVSISTSEIKLLYPTAGAFTQQNTLWWLDDQRFIAYEGFLINADQARNLRFVDMDAGTDRILFDGEFGSLSFDPVHETVALYALGTEKYPQGIYLVSINNSTIRYLEDFLYMSFPDWDENTGLFVSSSNCENDPQGLQAFDHQGNFKCVPRPTPTPEPWETASYPAPDGKWSISMKDGLWLETGGKAAVQISLKIPSDIIWCPDSSCFFFSSVQQNQQWTLYRVSLPDLTIKMVDEGIESRGSYQWLGAEK